MDDSTGTAEQLTLPFEPLGAAIGDALRYRLLGSEAIDLRQLLGSEAHRVGYYRAKRSGRVPLLLAESICDHLTWHARHLWPEEWDQVTDAAAQAGKSAPRARRSTHPVKLPPGVEHGTKAAYQKHRCSCDRCRAWMITWRRNWRARAAVA